MIVGNKPTEILITQSSSDPKEIISELKKYLYGLELIQYVCYYVKAKPFSCLNKIVKQIQDYFCVKIC